MRATVFTFAVVLALFACKKPLPVLIDPKEVHTPGLDPGRLAQTEAGKRGGKGQVKVAYCIDIDGVPQAVKVVEPFDPQIDAIAIETVTSWRYEPALKDGRPVETCRDVTFKVELAPPPAESGQ